ncbi:hypothetical protein BLOT_009829 [Blomia tropicalis]|nr:hypothetical protein BLOT_009829 [Blomia tropicalis]
MDNVRVVARKTPAVMITNNQPNQSIMGLIIINTYRNVSTSTTTEEVPKQEKNIVSSLQNNVLNQEKKLSTLGQKKQSQEDFFDSQMSYNETHFRKLKLFRGSNKHYLIDSSSFRHNSVSKFSESSGKKAHCSTTSECESMAEDVQHPKYNIDKCIPKSKLHNAVKIWQRIEHKKDFVYIYCWNQTLKYANFPRKCENASKISHLLSKHQQLFKHLSVADIVRTIHENALSTEKIINGRTSHQTLPSVLPIETLYVQIQYGSSSDVKLLIN